MDKEKEILDLVKPLLDSGKNLSEACYQLNLEYHYVYRRVKKYIGNQININRNGKSIAAKEWDKKQRKIKDDDRNLLYKMYIVDMKDMYEIAKYFNCSPAAVLYSMRRFKIPSRTKSEAIKNTFIKNPEIIEKHRKNANLGIIGVHKKGNNYSNSWIELAFQKWCQNNNIENIRSYSIIPGTHRYDFYLPKNKLLVECDGLYWHNSEIQKIKDKKHEEFAHENGYNVIRFTDKEIKESKSNCFDKILEFIKCK